jgi:hypothetical protein
VAQAGVLINPVVNIPANFYGSDIPDWAQVESGTWKPNPALTPVEELAKMYAASPMAHVHKVVAPTLLVLSSKDKRVPMLQSIHYYNELKARGVVTKCVVGALLPWCATIATVPLPPAAHAPVELGPLLLHCTMPPPGFVGPLSRPPPLPPLGF